MRRRISRREECFNILSLCFVRNWSRHVMISDRMRFACSRQSRGRANCLQQRAQKKLALISIANAGAMPFLLRLFWIFIVMTQAKAQQYVIQRDSQKSYQFNSFTVFTSDERQMLYRIETQYSLAYAGTIRYLLLLERLLIETLKCWNNHLYFVAFPFAKSQNSNCQSKRSSSRIELHLSILLIFLNCVFLLFITPHNIFNVFVGQYHRTLDQQDLSEGELCSVDGTRKRRYATTMRLHAYLLSLLPDEQTLSNGILSFNGILCDLSLPSSSTLQQSTGHDRSNKPSADTTPTWSFGRPLDGSITVGKRDKWSFRRWRRISFNKYTSHPLSSHVSFIHMNKNKTTHP